VSAEGSWGVRNAEPRPTVVRTLRPFESAWCVVQKLAGFNHVRPSEMARQVWTRTRFGRGTTVVFQPRGLAALLGHTALEAEASGPEHLLNRMSLSRLQVVRCDTVRYCPECLRTGYHSELFQLRAVQNCPEHGIALREVCPNCQTSIVPDARTRGAFTCAYCTAQVSNWLGRTNLLPHRPRSRLSIGNVDGVRMSARRSVRPLCCSPRSGSSRVDARHCRPCLPLAGVSTLCNPT
jgi:hypothetical protein